MTSIAGFRTTSIADRLGRPDSDIAELSELSWTTPEPKLWVAQRDGEFAGMIDFTAGQYVTTGPTGIRLGIFGDLSQAQDAVGAGQRPLTFRDGVLSNVAIVSAIVTLSVAGMGLTLLAA